VGGLGGVALLAAVFPARGADQARPGCSTRTATAYDGNGKVRPQPPGQAPFACMVSTGFNTVETHIAVTRDGTVVYEPAVITPGLAGTAYLAGAPGPRPQQPTSPAGIVVSHSQGASWDFIEPAGSLWTSTDAALYTDPVTGRLFEETLAPGQIPEGGDLAPQEQTPGGYAYLLASPDDGASWHHTALPGFLYQENARFTSAPPPPGQPATAGGYPDVTYWCGNREVGLTAPLILVRECYRSLDGGVTWARTEPLNSSSPFLISYPAPQHPECGASGEDITPMDGNYPQGASDGSLYLMVSCGGKVYLARSTDELTTTPILHTLSGAPLRLPVASGSGTSGFPELRVAKVGQRDELFLIYASSGSSGPVVQLKSSGDGGRTWSLPLTLTPHGLASIDEWSAAARGSEVSISYLSASKPVPGGYDGYLSVTPDALAPSPVVWTAIVNDPAAPMLRSAPQQAKDDFIGVDIGPDGSPWASFFSACSAESPARQANDPACEQAQGVSFPQGGNDRGVVGSLLWRVTR
jgi:hypothetical protein